VPGDVDLPNGVLTVRESKFRKSRLVPLHASATDALARYAAHRATCCKASRTGAFFRTERSPALTRAAVEKTFSRLRQRLGWTTDGRARRPRIHDMRHTFAVRRLLRWYEDGADIDRKILALATYLGHAKVTDTYWYLSGVPELMAMAARRFERFVREEQERGP
jgi:integrase